MMAWQKTTIETCAIWQYVAVPTSARLCCNRALRTLTSRYTAHKDGSYELLGSLGVDGEVSQSRKASTRKILGAALSARLGQNFFSCGEVDTIARAHLTDVERKLADLTNLASELREVIGKCGCGSVADCRIIEALSPLGEPA